jgi:hypothetical protein
MVLRWANEPGASEDGPVMATVITASVAELPPAANGGTAVVKAARTTAHRRVAAACVRGPSRQRDGARARRPSAAHSRVSRSHPPGVSVILSGSV